MKPLTETASMKDWYDRAVWTITTGCVAAAESRHPSSVTRTWKPAEDWRKSAEPGGEFEIAARDARDEAELAEDLAIAEQALDEYAKSGIEGTVSYNEYRKRRLGTEP